MNTIRLEAIRRLVILIALPLSAVLIGYTRPRLVALIPMDWEGQRRREIAALLSETERRDLSAYVARETEGHVVSLPGETWKRFFDAAHQTLAGDPPSGEWKGTARNADYSSRVLALYFAEDDPRVGDLLAAPEMASGFAYLRLDSESREPPAFLLRRTESQYVADQAPQHLLHPLRHAGWWAVLGGLLAYALIPWPGRSADQVTFSTPSQAFLADIVGVLLYGMFSAIGILLILEPSIPGHGEWSQILVFGLVFGTLALLGASVFLVALWYITLRIDWDDAGLCYHSLRRDASFPWTDIEGFRVEPISYAWARQLRALGLLLSLVNWRAAGPALLVQTESRVLRIAVRGRPGLTLDIGNAIPQNLSGLITELDARSISVAPAVRDVALSEGSPTATRLWPIYLAVAILAVPTLYAIFRTLPPA